VPKKGEKGNGYCKKYQRETEWIYVNWVLQTFWISLRGLNHFSPFSRVVAEAFPFGSCQRHYTPMLMKEGCGSSIISVRSEALLTVQVEPRAPVRIPRIERNGHSLELEWWSDAPRNRGSERNHYE
jgi:hypothetical protein